MMFRRACDLAVLVLIGLTVGGAWLVSRHEVVSGSMAPTLLGPHWNVTCPRCGHALVADAAQPPDDRLIDCPACGADVPLPETVPLPGDQVVVFRVAFALRAPRRWEVVAFRPPIDPSMLAVKRIVGLPGEQVQLVDGRILIDGQPVEPPRDVRYDRPSTLYESVGFDQPYQLSADEYFVLGDDAARSVDSRYRGFGPAVESNLLMGKPFLRVGAGVRWRLGAVDFQVPASGGFGYIR